MGSIPGGGAEAGAAIAAQAQQADGHPDQPLHMVNGVLRFKANAIVRHLLDSGGIDMNQLAAMCFSDEDRQQFAQLIGYSLGGYGDLSYVSDEAYARAQQAQGVPVGYVCPSSLKALHRGEVDAISLIRKEDADIAGELGPSDVPLFAAAPQAEPQSSVPEGYKPVPMEPTEAMFSAFSRQIDEGVVYVGGFLLAYRSMLDAAPVPAPTVETEPQTTAADLNGLAEALMNNLPLSTDQRSALWSLVDEKRKGGAPEAEPQPEREPLSDEQFRIIGCMDSWAEGCGLPLYSELSGIGTKGGAKP